MRNTVFNVPNLTEEPNKDVKLSKIMKVDKIAKCLTVTNGCHLRKGKPAQYHKTFKLSRITGIRLRKFSDDEIRSVYLPAKAWSYGVELVRPTLLKRGKVVFVYKFFPD